MELHVRPTFYIDAANGMSFTNLIAAENGGGICVYTRENSTFNFDNSISFANTLAKHGVILNVYIFQFTQLNTNFKYKGAIYFEGPGNFKIPISNYGHYR